VNIKAINQTNSFKGLWGETKKINKVTQNELHTDIYSYTNKDYYPFADEHLESLNKIIKDFSTYNTTILDEKNIYRLHSGTNISVKSFLYFTKKQWLKYIEGRLPIGSVELNFIEKNLKKLHLEKYLKV